MAALLLLVLLLACMTKVAPAISLCRHFATATIHVKVEFSVYLKVKQAIFTIELNSKCKVAK